MDTKKWYASKTIWGGVIMFISTILQITGVADITTMEQGAITDNMFSLVTVMGQLVGAVLAIYGRIKTTKAIA